MANEKNPVDALAIPNFDTKGWVEEQVGFAPYWEADKGQKIIARLVGKEEKEGTFTRYLLQAGQDMVCYRGAKTLDDDGKSIKGSAEKVNVKKGEFFTMSVFHSLQGLFDFYEETGLKPWMQIHAVEKVKTSTPGQMVWTWKLLVSPEDKKRADAKRMQLAAEKKSEALPAAEKPAEMTS